MADTRTQAGEPIGAIGPQQDLVGAHTSRREDHDVSDDGCMFRTPRILVNVMHGVAGMQRLDVLDLGQRLQMHVGKERLWLRIGWLTVDRSHQLLIQRVPRAGKTSHNAASLSLAVILGTAAWVVRAGLRWEVVDRRVDGAVVVCELTHRLLKDPGSIDPECVVWVGGVSWRETPNPA